MGVRRRGIPVTGLHTRLPSFGLHDGGGALRAAIIHYVVDTCTGYNDLVWLV